MYKGLFKVESMQKLKRGNLKSYSKKRASYAKSFAVCFFCHCHIGIMRRKDRQQYVSDR